MNYACGISALFGTKKSSKINLELELRNLIQMLKQNSHFAEVCGEKYCETQ